MARHLITTRELQRGIRQQRAEDQAQRWIESTEPHWADTVRSSPDEATANLASESTARRPFQ
jgi:hypothetical protein